MSFGESMNTGGFTQKTIKGDLIVRLHHVYPWWKLLWKDLEHTRRQPTEGDPEGLPCGASRPLPSVSASNVGSPPPPRLHLRHPFKSFHPTVIEGVDTDRWCGNALPPTPSPLYKALPILALGPSRNPNSYPPHQDQRQLSRED